MKNLLKILNGQRKASSEEILAIMEDLAKKREEESGKSENLNRELKQARQAALAGVDSKKTISGIQALLADATDAIPAIDATLRDLVPKLKEAELVEAQGELSKLTEMKIDVLREEQIADDASARFLARYSHVRWQVRGGDPTKILFSVEPGLPKKAWATFSEEIEKLKSETPEGFLPVFQRLQQIEQQKAELEKKIASKQ